MSKLRIRNTEVFYEINLLFRYFFKRINAADSSCYRTSFSLFLVMVYEFLNIFTLAIDIQNMTCQNRKIRHANNKPFYC